MDTEKLDALADCIKRLKKEGAALAKSSAISGNFCNTKSQRGKASENARESAIEIRRLKHEAHCLAVELGFADRRDESHYTPTTSPQGFGRVAVFDRRAPVAA